MSTLNTCGSIAVLKRHWNTSLSTTVYPCCDFWRLLHSAVGDIWPEPHLKRFEPGKCFT